MKYSLLLVGLLSVSTLLATDKGSVNVGLYENSQADLRTAKEETSNARIEASNFKIEANDAKIKAKEAEANEKEMKDQLDKANEREKLLKANQKVHISVTGQGVAPMNTSSPAQAYALAKRAAIADAYRAIAEKVKGVRIDGQDLIKNMMVKRSTIRTSVNAMVRNANVVETTFKEGLCEVEMEIVIYHADFAQ